MDGLGFSEKSRGYGHEGKESLFWPFRKPVTASERVFLDRNRQKTLGIIQDFNKFCNMLISIDHQHQFSYTKFYFEFTRSHDFFGTGKQ